jgi:hypothetical protein
MSLIVTANNTTYIFANKRGRPTKDRDSNHYDFVTIVSKRGRPVGSKNKPKSKPTPKPKPSCINSAIQTNLEKKNKWIANLKYMTLAG